MRTFGSKTVFQLSRRSVLFNKIYLKIFQTMSLIKIKSCMKFINDCYGRYRFVHFNYAISKMYDYIELVKYSKYNETNQYIY